MAYKLMDAEGQPIKVVDIETMGMDFVGVTKGVDLEKRILTIIATDETVDRDGDIIMVNGWDFKNYLKNPVFLWAHDYDSVPLAAAMKISKRINPKRVELTHRFSSEGLNPFADMILQLYHEKIANAGSVGFLPRKFEKIELDDPKPGELQPWSPRKYLNQELLEHSGCAVPCNPSAVQNAIKGMKGGNATKEKMYKYMMSDGEYELSAAKRQRAVDEIGEMVDKGTEFEEDTDSADTKVHQVPDNITKDDDPETDVSIGNIAPLTTGATITIAGDIELQKIIDTITGLEKEDGSQVLISFEKDTVLTLLQELSDLRDAEPANEDQGAVLEALSSISTVLREVYEKVKGLSGNQTEAVHDNIPKDEPNAFDTILNAAKGSAPSGGKYTDQQRQDLKVIADALRVILTHR